MSPIAVLLPVTVFPLVSGSPRSVACLGKRISGRAYAQYVEEQRFVVAFPSIVEKAAFGLPAVRDSRAFVSRPSPVRTAVQRIGKAANFTLVGCIGVEINARNQRTREQKSTIDRREFALPRAPASLHIEKMIVKTAITGRVRLGALVTRPEETQRRNRSFDRCSTRHESALDSDRISCERESDRGNACGPIRGGLIEHQPVDRIHLIQKITERYALEVFEVGFGGRLSAHGLNRLPYS